MTWNGKFWYAYFAMMKMTFQDMDDDDEFWDVACGRIKAEYLATDEGKQKLAKMERKIRKTVFMSFSAELAELYRTEPTGSKMLATLTRRYANRSSTVAVVHKVQRLEEDLRKGRYNVTEYIEVHLRRMRNKQLELATWVIQDHLKR